MARDPEQRYSSAGELADELTRFTTGALVKGYAYSTGELIRHYYRRNRALCNTAMIAAAVTLVVAIAAYVNILQANHRERLQRVAAEAAQAEAEGSAYRANIQLAANHIEGQTFDQATALLLEQPAALRNLEWALLFEQCNQDYATRMDQEAAVDRVWTAPGERLLTLSSQDKLVIRACPNLEPLHRIPLTHVMGATAAVSPDGAWLAVARVDGLLQLYDFQNYSPVHEFTMPGLSFDSVVFSGDGTLLASGTSDGTLLVWNCSTGALVREIDAHDAACQVFGMSRNGALAITSDRSGRTVLWDVTSGKLKQEFIGYGPSLNQNRDRFALRSGHVIQVRDLESGALLFESTDLPGEPRQPILSPSGLLVAAIVEDGVIRLWDVASGKPVATIQDDSLSHILGFSPDSELIALAATPHEIRICRTKDGATIASLKGHSNWIRAGAFSEDGGMFYSCAGESAIKAWQIPPANGAAAPAATQRISAIAVAKSAPVVAAGSSNGVVHILNSENLQPALTVASFDADQLTPIDINAEGDQAVVALGRKTAQVLRLPEGEVLAQWTGSPGNIRTLAYCQDGRTIATLGGSSSVYLWDSLSGRDMLRFDGHADKVLALSVMPSGDQIATGDRAGRVLLWDSASGTLKQELRAGGAPVTALACGPDGKSVAAAFAGEGAVILQTPPTHGSIPLSASGVDFTYLGFSLDGQRLIGLTRLNGFKLWDTRSGQQMAVLPQPKTHMTTSLLLDSAHDRILAGDTWCSLLATPAFPKALYAPDTISPESLTSHKGARTLSAQPVPLQSGFMVALTPATVAEEALQRLDSVGEDRLGELYTEPGSNPLARLGLMPGDSVTKLNGAPCADLRTLEAGLESFVSASESSPGTLRLSLAREGTEITIEHRRCSLVAVRRVIEVPRVLARAALLNTQALLRSQQDFLTTYSQRLDNVHGAGLEGPDALDGIWLPPTSSQKEDLDLAALGLGEQDQITAINGEAISSYAQLVNCVERAIKAVEEGFTGDVHLRVSRDRYQVLDLIWSVV
jgi:WD40 repeat protein